MKKSDQPNKPSVPDIDDSNSLVRQILVPFHDDFDITG